MEEGTVSPRREIITTIVVLLVVAGIVATVVATKKSSSSDTTATTPTPASQNNSSVAGDTTSTNSSTGSTTTTPSSGSSFKDGSYSATGSYESPGGTEKITIRVTLANGVITDTSATSGAIDDEGTEYQGDFIRGYKQLVVGKSIDSVSLSRVSGSSLTSQGFNDAISQIKQNAHS